MDYKNLDKIKIKDLLIRCIIGLNPDERIKKQDVIINITIYADLSRACVSDNIEDSVDYKTIKKEIIAKIENSSFLLIERMADEITKICLSRTQVKRVTVSVQKPGALRFARSVEVEITRNKDE